MVITGRKLEILDEECYEAMQKGYKQRTSCNLRSQSGIYLKFCKEHHLTPFPADTWQFIRYGRYLARMVTASGTVENYVGGVRSLHELGGFKVPNPKDKNWEVFMRGIKCILAKPIKQAETMTPEVLVEIYNFVNINHDLELVAYSACLVGFYLALRKSNLVPDTCEMHKFNSSTQPVRCDLRKEGNMFMLEVRWAKTLQYQERELLLPLVTVPVKTICPVFWLTYMLNRIPGKPNDPLFMVKGKEGKAPLSYNQIQRLLKQWVEKTGRVSDQWTMHCLQRGGTRWGMEVGFSTEDIMLMGDWKSQAYLAYLDIPVERRVDNIVRFMHHIEKVYEI